jgi:hypothetical protein
VVLEVMQEHQVQEVMLVLVEEVQTLAVSVAPVLQVAPVELLMLEDLLETIQAPLKMEVMQLVRCKQLEVLLVMLLLVVRAVLLLRVQLLPPRQVQRQLVVRVEREQLHMLEGWLVRIILLDSLMVQSQMFTQLVLLPQLVLLEKMEQQEAREAVRHLQLLELVVLEEPEVQVVLVELRTVEDWLE